ncbi:13485_t:CDS:2, partial [Dentiscutata heterogama]
DFCKKDPERVDNYFIYDFCCAIAKFYNSENAHQIVANKKLSEYFGCFIQPIELPANRKGDKPRTDSTISFSEPYFSVFSIVISDKAIIELLTSLYPLAWYKDDEIKLSISKTFYALKKSLQLLNQYYTEVDDKLA